MAVNGLARGGRAARGPSCGAPEHQHHEHQYHDRGRGPHELVVQQAFGRGGRRRFGGRLRRRRGRRSGHLLAEVVEELVRHLLGGAIDQARAQLRQLAADVRLGGVGQHRDLALFDQPDVRAALGETGGAPLALAGNRVALRRVEVGQHHVAVEFGPDRADLGHDDRCEFPVGHLVERLASWQRSLQRRWIVQRRPYPLARRGDAVLAGHVHGGFPGTSVGWRITTWLPGQRQHLRCRIAQAATRRRAPRPGRRRGGRP